jgi:hypothetical protein
LAGGLWTLAAALFALAMLLPPERGEVCGWFLFHRMVAYLFGGPPANLQTAILVAAIYPTCLFVPTAAAFVAGFRAFARVATIIQVFASGAVVAFLTLRTPPTVAAVGRFVHEGPGAVAWIVSFPVLAAAAFVWPRPAAQQS